MSEPNRNNNNNEGYGQKLIEGLAPAIQIPTIGTVFKDTTQALAVKINEEISGTFSLPELDNIIITPRVARNDVGATELIATAYFSTNNPNGNIYYRGGKGRNSRGENGRVNMVNTAGIAAGGTGPFGTNEHFNTVIKPLCKVNEKGNPVMNIKSVPGANGLAQIELDFNALLCLALSIKPNDPYDFGVLSVEPIPNTSNFSIVIAKMITSNSARRGKNSQINYSRIEQEQYKRFNGGGNRNGGGRTFG